MKKYLIIETFPNTPHIETSVEIALSLKKQENEVYFFWCGYDLPWKDWELPWYKKFLLFSFEKKIEKIKSYLKKKNINIIPRYNLDVQTHDYIDKKTSIFNNFQNLNKFKYKKNFSAGIACLSSLISKYHKTEDISRYNNQISKALKAGCLIYERSLRVIKDINPDYVLTFNSRFILSRPIIDATKLQKKNLLIHERGSSPNKYMIHRGDIFDKKYYSNLIHSHWLEKKISINKKINISKKYFDLIIKKKFYKNIGLPFEIKSKNKIKLNKIRKIITFFCSTDHEYTSFALQKKKYNFYINSKWNNQINATKSIINIINKDKNFFLFIKAHPNFSKKNSIDRKLEKLEAKNIKYLSNKDEVDSIDLLKKSDIVITFGSTMELTAKYLNKKVIPMFKHLYSELDIFDYPKDEKSLKKMIYYKQKRGFRKNLQKVAYFFMTYGFNYKYFKPTSFFRGNLIEEKINYFGPIINLLVKFKILKY